MSRSVNCTERMLPGLLRKNAISMSYNVPTNCARKLAPDRNQADVNFSLFRPLAKLTKFVTAGPPTVHLE